MSLFLVFVFQDKPSDTDASSTVGIELLCDVNIEIKESFDSPPLLRFFFLDSYPGSERQASATSIDEIPEEAKEWRSLCQRIKCEW
jgi:hypothetical protein